MLKKIYVTLLATAFFAGMSTLAMAGSDLDKVQDHASTEKSAIESMEKSQILETPAQEAEQAKAITAEPIKEQAKGETAEAYSEPEKDSSAKTEAIIDKKVEELEHKEAKE
jgi:hypothetical protein